MGAQASITRKEMGPPSNMRLTENQGSDAPTKRLHLSAVSFLRDLFHSQGGLKCAGGRAMIAKAVMPSLLSVLIVCGFAAWAQSFDLPVGPGKEIVENTCGTCHPINRLGAGYTPEGWHSVVHMMQNMEVPVPPEQWATVAEYLIKSFPDKPKPAAAIVAGPVQVSITQWPVPTAGSRPHDPWASRDGSIQRAVRSNSCSRRRKIPGPMAFKLIPRVFRISSNSVRTRSAVSIPAPCKFGNSPFAILAHGRGAWRSQAITSYGTQISSGGISVVSIQRPVRSRNGSLQAVRGQNHTASS